VIALQVDAKQLEKLRVAIGGSPKKLKSNLQIAVNKTAGQSKKVMAAKVAERVKITQAAVKPLIAVRKAAGASGSLITASARLKPTKRISLREFGARQNKKGVTYQIAKYTKQQSAKRKKKGQKNREFIPGAFIVQSLGGHVFERKGKESLPIEKRMGPSAWGVFVVGEAHKPARKELKLILKKQIDKRIQFINFKKTQG
jgi:hypothetical protein